MPSRPPLRALLDIRDNARLTQQWTAAQTRESFRTDQQIFYAVTRCLEIVSEAARRLPQSMRDRHPRLPWRAIMDVGNVYRHAYDNVEEDIVWRTVQQRLPELLAVIEDEITKLDDNDQDGFRPR
jgi:uncharacterized protein with HEPN domain